MAISKIPSAGFQDNVKFRNIIINGDMSIAQRGTSTSSVSTTQYPSLDRWNFLTQTAGSAVFTISQDSDVPSGQGFSKSHKIDVTTAHTYSSGHFTCLRTMFEGQNLQYLKKGTSSAESLTMSFWVKSNKTGTYILELDDNDNGRNINKSYTINSANTWEKKIITFDGDTTGVFDNDNLPSLRILWWLASGTDYSSGTLQTSWGSTVDANRAVGQVNLADSTSNEWLITGVQLESGSASDFEFLPRAVMESLCFRYFYTVTETGIPGLLRADGNNTRDFYMPYKVTMRANPTITSNADSITNLGTFSNTYPSPRQLWGRVSHTNDTQTIFMKDDVNFDAEL